MMKHLLWEKVLRGYLTVSRNFWIILICFYSWEKIFKSFFRWMDGREGARTYEWMDITEVKGESSC